MAKHRFPCPKCNHEVSVNLTQSGQEMTCPKCSHHFELPKFQELKEYPVADSSVSNSAAQQDQRLSRSIFASGMLILLLFGVAAAGLQFYANHLIASWDLSDLDSDIASTAESLVPAEIVKSWYQLEDKAELQEWQEHPAVRNRTQGQYIQKFAYGIWALAGVGLLLTIISPLFKKK